MEAQPARDLDQSMTDQLTEVAGTAGESTAASLNKEIVPVSSQPMNSSTSEPETAAAAAAVDAKPESEPGPATTTALAPGSADDAQTRVADEQALEQFCRTAPSERVLTKALRGVLAETALTGRIRYPWALLRPLVEFVMEQVLTEYDRQQEGDIGPSKFFSYGETVAQTLHRFKNQLGTFTQAPWTVQRLAELLLEPGKQYRKLHKVVLAVEKCLLVTGEIPQTTSLPPLPLLSELGSVNECPPSVYTSTANIVRGGSQQQGASGSARGREDDSSSAFTNSMLDVRGSPGHGNSQGSNHGAGHHQGSHVGVPEHIEEDHWPENGMIQEHLHGHHVLGHGHTSAFHPLGAHLTGSHAEERHAPPHHLAGMGSGSTSPQGAHGPSHGKHEDHARPHGAHALLSSPTKGAPAADAVASASEAVPMDGVQEASPMRAKRDAEQMLKDEEATRLRHLDMLEEQERGQPILLGPESLRE